MRRNWVIANWKMNGDSASIEALLTTLKSSLVSLSAEVVVCPPAVYLGQVQRLVSGTLIGLGAQNANANASGAHTGEVALPMLAEFDCSHVLVGHSERRSLYAESDDAIAEKFQAVIAANLTPVLCVGESEQERSAGRTEEVVIGQLNAVIDKVGVDSFREAIVAYEPVWAIGTGKTATPEQAQEVHRKIRQRVEELSQEVAEQLPILYGGSVNAENAASLFGMPDIDGGLVGGASLDSEAFTAICKAG